MSTDRNFFLRDSRVQSYEHDEDGHWIYLCRGWAFQDDTHTIHEDTLQDAREALWQIAPCSCNECARG